MAPVAPSLNKFDVQEIYPSEDQPLFYLSVNPSARETILLLHGLTASCREWLNIAAFLAPDYHLLIPDLPGHSRSRKCRPLALPTAADYMANIIRSSAHEGVCHVAGFSMGGYTALALAEKYPDLVVDLFASGVYDMGKSRWASMVKFAPYVEAPTNKIMAVLPAGLLNLITRRVGIKYPEGAVSDLGTNSSVQLLKEGLGSVLEFGEGKPVKARSCLIAASKHDDVPGTRALCHVLQSGDGNQLSRAFILPDMMHAWGLQNAELFAKAIKSWLTTHEMPSEFTSMD